MSTPQRFSLRASVGFGLTACGFYLGFAFISTDMAFWHWSESARTTAVILTGMLGVPTALLAGCSAIQGL